ncbi:MAG: lipopolysaccharide assembly protein LapA domain-containing protein [Nitrospinales bacterium]
MSLKFILGLLLFVILSIYLSFLNPQDVEFYLTNSYSVKLPLAVFLLGSILIGVVFTGIFTGISQIGNFFRHLKESQSRKKQEKLNMRWGKIFLKAQNAFVSGRQPKAIGLFEKILSKNPDHTQSLYYMGQYMKDEGKYDDAISLHKKAILLEPDNIQVLYALSEDYAAADMHEKELKTLEKILQLDRNSLPTLRKMRDACLKLEDWGKAYTHQKAILPLIHDSDELITEQNRFSQIVYSKGKQLHEKGNNDSAIVEFKRSIRENIQSLPAYITLGDIYLEAKNSKAALKTWKAGYAATQSPICLVRIQGVLQSTEQIEDINKLYNGAIRSAKPEEMEPLAFQFGTFLMQQGNIDEAINTLESIENPSLPLRLLIIKAYREKQDNEHVESLTQSACDDVVKSFTLYFCSKCQVRAEEWAESCRSCHSWDSLNLGPNHIE